MRRDRQTNSDIFGYGRVRGSRIHGTSEADQNCVLTQTYDRLLLGALQLQRREVYGIARGCPPVRPPPPPQPQPACRTQAKVGEMVRIFAVFATLFSTEIR